MSRLLALAGATLAGLALLASGSQARACSESSPKDQRVELDGRAYTLHFAVVEVEERERDLGFSGLSRDASGQLWSISEETRRLLKLGPTGGPTVKSQSSPIAIGPPLVEAESLAFLPNGDVAIGTECSGQRTLDALVFATVRNAPEMSIARDPLVLPYSTWNIVAPSNEGLEGISVVGDTLIVVIEAVAGNTPRYAPVLRGTVAELRASQAELYRVRLTSETGKLSAIDCRPSQAAGSLVCRAIERHFGITRIVEFELPDLKREHIDAEIPMGAHSHEVTPRIVLDLSPFLPGCTNLEGLVWDGDELTLISDNDAKQREGPTRILTLAPARTRVNVPLP